MNSVNFVGRVARDPIIRWNNDMAIARFPLALNRGKDKNGEDRGADFASIVVFGRTAENIEKFVGKGSLLEVEGRLQTGSYQNKEGKTVYTTDFVATKVGFLSTQKNGNASDNNQQHAAEGHEGLEPLEDEDCPF